jgi:hemolysin activation/secretion protein
MQAFIGIGLGGAFPSRLRTGGLNCASSFFVATLPLLCSSATAQTPPDAGSIRQQIEQPRALPRMPSAAQRAAPPPEIRPPVGLSVSVKGFRFAGNTLLDTDSLVAAVAPFENQTLDFAGLQRAADAVATAYRQAGWIVRVYLPEQDVTEGLIALQVIEARFGGVRFEGEPPKLVPRERIEGFFTARQRVEEPLGSDALDRALLLSDDLPGVSVAGTLGPGSSDAQTVLVLQTTDEPVAYGDVTIDNTGSRTTGNIRLAANLNFNSPLGVGDLVSINALRTRGSEYGRIGMTVPVGTDGLRIGVNASSLHYQVVEGTGASAAIPIHGGSDSLGLDLNYPIHRARRGNAYFLAGVDRKNFLNRDTEVRSDYGSYSVRLGVSANLFDQMGGGGANSVSLQWVAGRLADMRVHTQRETLPRRFNKLVYGASRQQALSEDHSIYLSLTGQHAWRGLDSSEKFFVGGASSVRAYPVSELGGERGQVFSGEWRWRPLPDIAITGFFDWGRVVALPATSSDSKRELQLRGKGVSLAWQAPHGWTPRLTWSRRNGANPQPTPAGTDGDGTLKLDRYWLSLSRTF